MTPLVTRRDDDQISHVSSESTPRHLMQRIKINVSGSMFEIPEKYLKKFPTSLLGDVKLRQCKSWKNIK